MKMSLSEVPLVDTHAHLHMRQFDHDRRAVYERSAALAFILNVSTSMKDVRSAVEVTTQLENCYAAVGVHPHDAKDVSRGYVETLKKYAESHDKVIAIGEIGLDFYRNFSPRETQEKVFAEQLMLAHELDLPVILHIRDAYLETYDIIEAVGVPRRGGVVHAFGGDVEWAKRFVELGFVLGIGGPITYPKNSLLREVVKVIGVEYVVTETDCPYLPPQEQRGRRNEPAFVSSVLKIISEVVSQDIRSVAEKITSNVQRTFGVSLRSGVERGA